MIASTLQNHTHTLADLADSCGQNWQAIAPYIYQQTGNVPITRGIHKSKEYRGKVYCFINHWTAPDGKIYPTVTFGTHKHGGIVEVFNGYRETMANRGYSDNYIQQQQPRQPRREYIAPIESLENWQVTALNVAKNALDSATSEGVESHDYVTSKGLNVDGCDIRRGIGKFGDCLMIAVVDSFGAAIGYQQIYAQNIPNKNTNKYFIGRTGGGFVVIGDKSQVPFGAIYCEGLATGLSIYHSDGTTKGELKNNRKTPVVVCLSAGNMRNVVANHVAEFGADNVKIYADNDCGKDSGNTGIFTTLQICKENGIKKYRVPVSENGAACDFADTLKFKDYGLPKNRIDYQKRLIEVCPLLSIKRHWQALAFTLADTYRVKGDIEIFVDTIAAACDLRGLDVRIDALNLITRAVNKQREIVRKLKTITDFNGITRFNVDGKTIAEIATLIEFETIRTNGVMTFDNRGMGGNKTTNMIELVNRLKGGIAYISPLTSVCKNAGDRLNFYDYQSTSAAFINAHSHGVNLSVCINSIIKFSLAQNFTHLFIDEAAAVYDSIFDDTGTNSHQQAAIIAALKSAIQAAQSVLIADAGLSDKVVAFFKSLAGDKQINLIETTQKQSDKKHWLLKNHSHAHEFILRDVINGRHGVVACDTVANAIAVKRYLIKHGGVDSQIDINRILLATGENNGDENVSDFIEKPNDNAYRYDVVIHSPIIKSGTSIEYKGYSFAYLLYDGVISTSDAMQMLGRCRNATDVYVSFGKRIDKTRVTDFEMLMNGEIESLATELEQKGYDIKATDLIAQRDDLARLRHEFTATKHADLNDYQRIFMLFAEIGGREFTRVESDIEIDTNHTKETKAARVDDRLNAKILTANEYQIIKNSNIRTQQQTDAMKRYDTALMAHGAANITTDSIIASVDVENELDGMTDVLDAFEFIGTSTSELKALDKTDSDSGCLKFSRVQLQKALIEVLTPLQKASDGGGITRKDFNKSLDMAEKNHRILSLATFGAGNLRLGNFKKTNRIRAGATVGNLLEKLGYEINKNGQIGTKKQTWIYDLKVNDDIARYAANRKGLGVV